MTNSLDGAEERGGIFMIMMMWWLSLTIYGGLFWTTLPFLSENTTQLAHLIHKNAALCQTVNTLLFVLEVCSCDSHCPALVQISTYTHSFHQQFAYGMFCQMLWYSQIHLTSSRLLWSRNSSWCDLAAKKSVNTVWRYSTVRTYLEK